MVIDENDTEELYVEASDMLRTDRETALKHSYTALPVRAVLTVKEDATVSNVSTPRSMIQTHTRVESCSTAWI